MLLTSIQQVVMLNISYVPVYLERYTCFTRVLQGGHCPRSRIHITLFFIFVVIHYQPTPYQERLHIVPCKRILSIGRQILDNCRATKKKMVVNVLYRIRMNPRGRRCIALITRIVYLAPFLNILNTCRGHHLQNKMLSAVC
jgi:hypothetical protein